MSTMRRNRELEAKLIGAMQVKEVTEQEDTPDIDSSKCCPICGSQCFETVRKSNGILGPGGISWTSYHICAGCSVMFADPARFLREQGTTND